ncbi:Lsr2 family protein [Brachybacterium halotolerans subsp. kimchii]|uniref:histone-like nucleoid-structuring protein Lsr2 n=1 Tax=Brachybacterium halotolerans TaxID=2795215 RepID=UPI001E522A9C|nr:Lsr2 family protein [Brachybacterium halotolerans]UEJ82814.1 Lsr2 family protein [Brachybacterium halotolerans subsp. kimchii]
MARVVKQELIDDLDGSAAEESITFAVEGRSYEIDLNAENAAALRADLERWERVARRSTSRGSSARGGSAVARRDRRQLEAIRGWARENGHQVSDRGRIPRVVEDAYNAAHGVA